MQSASTMHGAARWQLDPREQLDALADQPDAQWVSTQPPRKDPVVWIELGAGIPVEAGGRYDSPQRREYEDSVLQALLALPEVLRLTHSVQHRHKGGSRSRIEVCLREDAAARAAAEQMMESGVLQVAGLTLPVRYATGRQPSGTVRVMVLGLPGPYARRGLVEALLTCAGYMAGTGMVVAEFLGELCLGGVPYPSVGRGDMIVAFIKAPSEDQLLRDLPDTLLLQGCTVHLAVEGREGLDGRSRGYVPVSQARSALQGRSGRNLATGAVYVPPPPPPRGALGAGGLALRAAEAATVGGVGGASMASRGPSAVASSELQPSTNTHMEGVEPSSPVGPPLVPAPLVERARQQPTSSSRLESIEGGSPGGLQAVGRGFLPGVASRQFPPPPPRRGPVQAFSTGQVGPGPTAAAIIGAPSVSSLRAGACAGMGVAGAPERPTGSSSSELTGGVPASMPPGPWNVGPGSVSAGPVPLQRLEPPGAFGSWLMQKKFAGAMAEAIEELAADQAEKDRALRQFFDLYKPLLMRPGTDDPATAGDLPGFAQRWLQNRFPVPGYPCSDDDAEQPVHAPAGRARGRKGRRGRGRGGGGAHPPTGRAKEAHTSRERSRSAGVSPAPSVGRGSTCPDPPAGLRRSARQSKPPDLDSMYSSRVVGGNG